MANNPSAQKRNRQSLERRARNRRLRSRMRTAIRKLRTAAEAGERETAAELLPGTLALIDASVQKGVVHRNAAARYKSRLTKTVRRADTAE